MTDLQNQGVPASFAGMPSFSLPAALRAAGKWGCVFEHSCWDGVAR
jgi:hypothetical protein